MLLVSSYGAKPGSDLPPPLGTQTGKGRKDTYGGGVNKLEQIMAIGLKWMDGWDHM